MSPKINYCNKSDLDYYYYRTKDEKGEKCDWSFYSLVWPFLSTQDCSLHEMLRLVCEQLKNSFIYNKRLSNMSAYS